MEAAAADAAATATAQLSGEAAAAPAAPERAARVPAAVWWPSSLAMAPGQSAGRSTAQHSAHNRASVQWSEDMIKADPFFGRSRVRFRVPPWVSSTIARDHLA